MKVDEAVYKRLSGFAALTALVPAARITPVRASQTGAYPYVTYQVISDNVYPAMSRDAVPHRARVQVNSFHKDFTAMRAVDAQVRAALSRFRGTSGTVTVQDIFEDTVQDLDAPEVGDGVFHRARDFIIFYEV